MKKRTRRVRIRLCETCGERLSYHQPPSRKWICPNGHEWTRWQVAQPDEKQAHREKQRIRNNKAKAEKRALVSKLKSENPCVDCGGFFHFSAMDYDHVRGDKVVNVALMIGVPTYSIKDILNEIEKCELVCSNCHRVRTYNRRYGLGDEKCCEGDSLSRMAEVEVRHVAKSKTPQ